MRWRYGGDGVRVWLGYGGRKETTDTRGPLVSGTGRERARVCRGSGWLRPLVCWAKMLSWAPAVLAVGPGFQVSILFFYFPFSFISFLF
jgi:hypothetical protein